MRSDVVLIACVGSRIRRRFASPKTTMWSAHSRRVDPINRSAKPFCHCEADAASSTSYMANCACRRRRKYSSTSACGYRLVEDDPNSRGATRLVEPGVRGLLARLKILGEFGSLRTALLVAISRTRAYSEDVSAQAKICTAFENHGCG